MRTITTGLALLFAFTSSASAQHDYKVSRNQIRKGNYEAAIKTCLEKIGKSPQDSEWVYQLAIAQAQAGQLDESIKHLERAVSMGVTTGRVAADSHNLLQPMHKKPAFTKLLEPALEKPIQGPMVGSLTSTSAKFWLRTAQPATVSVIATGAAGESVSSEEIRTSEASDYTAVLTLSGLQPHQRYSYSVHLDGKPADSFPDAQHFQTPPGENEPARFRLAFGGGAGYVPEHEYVWKTVAKENPSLLLLLGDNMYSDDPTSPTMQKFCYYRRQSPGPFRQLVAHTAVATIWDDHDFGTNDCSGGPDLDKPSWKRPVWNIFRQNWNNHGYGGGEQQLGCWYTFHVGNVQFIMLDGRCFRHRPKQTMLGPVQKEWLKKTLRESQATFKVLASPVPWEYRTKGDSKDTWNGFREERTEIFDYLAEHNIAGVILMSADRHRSDAWKIDRPNGYSLYEFNSSRLTNNHTHGTMKEAIFSYNKTPSFGLVEFDTTATDPTVTYTVVTIDGAKPHTLQLKLSQLK